MKQLGVSFVVLFSAAVVFAQQGGPPPHGPPPEALAACQGKSSDAACSFTHQGRTLEGTCFTPSRDLPLACRPAGGPPPGGPGERPAQK
jgi:hypothetical protein